MKNPWPGVFVAALLTSATVAFAQTNDPWIGRRVITQDGTVLRVGKDVVDDAGRTRSLTTTGKDRSLFRTYRVEHTRGDWLWLKDENSGVRGWVRTGSVIPLEQAIDYFTNRIRAEPSAANYHRRGLAWRARGEYDLAINDYNQAIGLEPGDASNWISRGSAWAFKKEDDKAIANYTEAIRLDPNYALAFRNRGIAWAHKGNYDRAIADDNEAIRLDPNDVDAFNGRGNAWRNKRDYDKAIADYNEAIRLDPSNELAFLNRGYAWSLKKDDDKALADDNEAIRLDPKDALAFRNRGSVLARKKVYDKAVADYGEAIRLDPKAYEAFNSMAWLLSTCPEAKVRDGKKAVEAATTACELSNWKDGNCLDTLAASYAEAGDFEKAVEWQRKANALYAEPEQTRSGEERVSLYERKTPFRQEK